MALSRPDAILPIVGDVTRMKTYNMKIKFGMCKRFIQSVMSWQLGKVMYFTLPKKLNGMTQ
jgi:hypothetical protein